VIQGTARPCSLTLKVNDDGQAFGAVGDGKVKLSSYEITPPSQLGIRAMDEVKVHLDLVARHDDQIASAVR
jgi:polyisoprenoid-binding protein YceI